MPQSIFKLPRAVPLSKARQLGTGPASIIWMHEPGECSAHEVCFGPTQGCRPGWIYAKKFPLEVAHDKHVLGDVPDTRAFSRFQLDPLFQDLVEMAERCLGFEVLFLGLFAQFDILAETNPFSDGAIWLQNRRPAGPMPHINAIASADPIFGLVKRPRVHGLLPSSRGALAIIRVQ